MRLALLAACLTGVTLVAAVSPPISAEQVGPRRPIALALSADESQLLVANRDAGSISVVDAGTLELLAEANVGKQLQDVVHAGQGTMLAIDGKAGELLLLAASSEQIRVLSRSPVSPDPRAVVVEQTGGRAYVSSRWSRRVSVVDLPAGDSKEMKPVATIDLPFAPGSMLLVNDDGVLIVADEFGGRLGVVDSKELKLTAVRKFYAHNIRGLGVDPKSKLLAVSHSMLNEYATTVRNDVHWGVLMSNDLRWLSLEDVLDPEKDFYNRGHMHPLGEPGMGGSEPGEVAFASDGTVVVTMTGVDKVAFGKEGDFGLHRVNVGRGPTAVVVSDKHRRAYVANTYADSISVIDLEKKVVAKTISLGESRKLTLAERGEELFHSGRLSHDGWMTCHSCHSGGHSAGDLNDNFSDKSFGAPKRVLTLLGAADTAPYAWNGEMESLAEQIQNSNRHTMQGRPISDGDTAALVAFIESLDAPPPVDQLRGTQDSDSIARGKEIFHGRKCTTCHAPPSYTSPKTYDVGLHDDEGNTHFNPPSLRGLSQRAPYFHDGRAKTLTEVFTEHGHQLDGEALSDEQLRDLIAFLRSL